MKEYFLSLLKTFFNKHIRRSLGKLFIVQNEISAIHHLTIQIYYLIFYEKILLCGDVFCRIFEKNYYLSHTGIKIAHEQFSVGKTKLLFCHIQEL